MSKMGSEFIRAAEARSLDNAEMVASARAEAGRLAVENGHLRARVERLEVEKVTLVASLRHMAALAEEAIEARDASDDPEDRELLDICRERLAFAERLLAKHDA